MSGRIQLLYLDGDTDPAEPVVTALERAETEFSVTTAEPGSETVRTASGDRFDCVISATSLTPRSDAEVFERIKAFARDCPVVLYTDQSNAEIAAVATAPNITYLPRERSTDQHTGLAQTVEKVIDRQETLPETDAAPERLAQILKTVPACVVELNTDGQFVYANRRAKSVLGLDRSEVTGREYNDPDWMIRDEFGDPIPDEELPFRQVLETDEPLYDYRHSIQWPDGSKKILSVSGVPLHDSDGNVDSVVFSLSDVTDRTRREQTLQRYRQIVQHLDDIATIIDPDGTIKYVSPAVERILGYEPSELIGENGFGYQPPETASAVGAAIEQVIEHPDEPHTVQTKFRRADGSWAWIESTLRNRLDDDGIDGILVSSREVTERVDQTQHVQKRERQLSRLHAATRDILASETPEEVAETASRTAVDVLDLPLNGIHFYDETADGLVPVAVSPESKNLFGEIPTIDEGVAWTAFTEGEEQIHNDLAEATELYNAETPVESELHLPIADHGVFIISATETEAFGDTDIEFARVLAANTEAALKRLRKEQQLRRRETELEQQNERLEEFASIVSHDLRNPLNVAQTRTELLAEESSSEHLPAISRSLDRMEDIVSDTLTLAKQGDVVAETERVAISPLAETCWQTAGTDQATLDVVEEIAIRGDRDRLRHVFENLFRNAVEHGEATAVIRIGRVGEEGFYVEDTGPGIPDNLKDKVFDPGHTSEQGGTGFGLTIVNRIAEAHGWTVRVVDGTDGGARFEFTGVEIVD